MFKFYKVGGCVRDQLLGIKPKDIDYVAVLLNHNNCDNDINVVYNLLCDNLIERGYTILVKYIDCFTIKAKNIKTKEILDIVLARKEIGYDSDSRRPNIVIGTLYDDLIRRDFTINALAIDEETKEIIDICDGINNLKNKILKTPLDATITLLNDPLRILRGIRFSITKNFKLDPEFFIALKNQKIWEKFRKVVNKERTRNELDQMFKHDTIATLNMLFEIKKISDNLYGVIMENITLKPLVIVQKN